MMKLYYAPNTIAIAPALLLNEGGVHYEAVRLDFPSGEQRSPAYHAINPKGRVPAITTPEGILTEAGAILEYLAATAVPGFVPSDPLHAARMREVMYYLASTMHPNHAHGARGSRWANEAASLADMKAKVPETMTASTAYIEDLMVGPCLFGDAPTLADLYLYVVSCWLEADGVDLAQFPKMRAFREVMGGRASVQKARSEGMLT